MEIKIENKVLRVNISILEQVDLFQNNFCKEMCTKMKGSAIHNRQALLSLLCLCLCLLFSSNSAVNEKQTKTGEWIR